MEVPGIVEDALDGEDVAAHVDLGGDDDLYVTATRTLIYRSEGLLSDESVEAYDHDAERLSISEGRRKTKLTLTYPVEGTEEFTLPGKSADHAIPAILAGVLNANGILDAGESVLDTFLFSELTLVVTSDRLVKHVGGAVWDKEFEEFRYADVTGISEEAGSVATQIVLEVDGRAERIKTPNDRAPEVQRSLEEALRAYYDLGEHEDVTAALSPEDEPAEDRDDGGAGGNMNFEDGVDPLDAGDTTDRTVDGLDADPTAGDGSTADATTADAGADGATATARDAGGSAGASADAAAGGASASAADGTASAAEQSAAASDAGTDAPTGDAGSGAADATATEPPATDDAAAASDAERADESDPFEEAGFESAADAAPGLEAEVEELREAVQKQNKLLARQQETIDQLVEELRRGR